ncbi:MAG: V-type ATPase subunit [Candidatus Methanomethylicia archaeon]
MNVLGALRYGFINTKIRGMKREYITMEQYNKIIEAPYQDLVKILMETVYGEALREFNETPTPIEIEKALLKSLTKSYIKVLKWLPTQAMKVIALHMMKYEIENIKSMLRLKTLNASIERLKEHITPIPLGLKIEDYVKIYEEAKSVEEAIRKLIEVEVPIPIEEIIEREITDITLIEAYIDKAIYKAIFNEAKKLDGKSSKSIRELLGLEVDLTNIKNVLRAKKLKLDWNETEENMITPTYKIGLQTLKRAFEKDNIEEALREAMGKHYKELLKQSIEALSKAGLETLEKFFNKEIYRNYQRVWKGGFQHDLSPTLAYLTRKWIEVKNIKVIAYGKNFGLQKQKIIEELIIT